VETIFTIPESLNKNEVQDAWIVIVGLIKDIIPFFNKIKV